MYSLNNLLLLVLLSSGLLFGPFGPYFGGISINKLIFVATVLLSFVIMACSSGFSYKLVLVLIGWLIFILLFGFLLPAANGTHFSYAMSEIRSLAWSFLIIPITLCVRSGGWNLLVTRLSVPVMLVALVIDFVFIAATVGYPEIGFALRVLLGVFAEAAGSATDNIYIGPISDGSFRVMWIFSIVLPFYALWVLDNLSGIIRFLCFVILVVAVIASGSRALLFLTVMLLALRIKGRQALTISLALGLFASILSIAFFPALGEIRIFSLMQDFSAGSARGGQIIALISEFVKHPIFGNGFGFFNYDFIRNVHAPFSYEFVYLSLLTKVGILGLIYLFLLILALSRIVGMTKKRLTLCFSFILLTSTNPYLWTLLGIFCFCFCVFYYQREDYKGERQ